MKKRERKKNAKKRLNHDQKYTSQLVDEEELATYIDAAVKQREAREFFEELYGEKPCNIRLTNIKKGK